MQTKANMGFMFLRMLHEKSEEELFPLFVYLQENGVTNAVIQEVRKEFFKNDKRKNAL
jgi:hypothetical protein